MISYAYTLLVTSWWDQEEFVAHDEVSLEKDQPSVKVRLVGDRTATIEVTEGYRITKEGVKISAPGGLRVKESDQRVYAGDASTDPKVDETRLLLASPFEGISMRLVLKRMPRKRLVLGPKGKVCGQCRWWDNKEGHRMLTEATHKGFQNGAYCFPDVVARGLAEEFNTPYLHADDTGYCPRRRELISRRGESCEQFERNKIPFMKRLWSWLRGDEYV